VRTGSPGARHCRRCCGRRWGPFGVRQIRELCKGSRFCSTAWRSSPQCCCRFLIVLCHSPWHSWEASGLLQPLRSEGCEVKLLRPTLLVQSYLKEGLAWGQRESVRSPLHSRTGASILRVGPLQPAVGDTVASSDQQAPAGIRSLMPPYSRREAVTEVELNGAVQPPRRRHPVSCSPSSRPLSQREQSSGSSFRQSDGSGSL
jgi:hypothetical protein